MKPLPIPQFEFGFAKDCFSLISEVTEDGERVSRELEQRRRDKEHSEQLQERMFNDFTNGNSQVY